MFEKGDVVILKSLPKNTAKRMTIESKGAYGNGWNCVWFDGHNLKSKVIPESDLEKVET
jgi:uncharacterized protein YodC (DUF2158 family)